MWLILMAGHTFTHTNKQLMVTQLGEFNIKYRKEDDVIEKWQKYKVYSLRTKKIKLWQTSMFESLMVERCLSFFFTGKPTRFHFSKPWSPCLKYNK